MKHTRLLEIIREEIAGALNEAGLGDQITALERTKDTFQKQKAPITKKEAEISKKIADLQKKQADAVVKAGSTLEEDTLNEVPDFGGKLDQGVAKEFGEKNTLQNAVDKIVGETLTDMGVTLEDLKKDKAKATEALTSIREKVLGAKRKNIPQDPRVTKALEKQEDVEVATLGAISGKSLQQNQTENAIKKALGLVTPGKQGRKADPNKPEKPASTGKKGRPAGEPKAEKTATLTPGDDGFDDVSYSDDEEGPSAKDIAGDETAKELGNISSRKDKVVKAYQELQPQVKDKIDQAKAGDKESANWLKDKWTPILKAYNKAKEVKI
jgi:hypothetical protein